MNATLRRGAAMQHGPTNYDNFSAFLACFQFWIGSGPLLVSSNIKVKSHLRGIFSGVSRVDLWVCGRIFEGVDVSCDLWCILSGAQRVDLRRM